MSYSRTILFIGCIAALHAPSLSGQTTVAVGNPAKELKRTAHQLRISVEHLKNAREALKQATELARRSADLAVFSQLAQNWIRIDRSQAPGALEDLYAWVRAAARDAADIDTYQRNMSAAQALLRQLATLDSERALMLWQRWPDPPSSLDETWRKGQAEAAAQFAKQLSAAGSGSSLPSPTNLAQLREEAGRGVYTSAATLATFLSQSGDKAGALQVVDGALANFRQRDPDPSALSSYLTFLRQLPYMDPDRFLSGLSAALLAIDKIGSANAGGTVTVGTETTQLTGSEAAVLDMCRNLIGRPDLAMKTLNSLPGLKSKLDRLGGVDNLLSPSGRSLVPVSMNYSIDGRTRFNFNTSGFGSSGSVSSSFASASGPGGANPSPEVDLYESVRGQLAKNPALVQRRLAEASKNPDQIDALIQLANRSSYQEPDLASMALEAAGKLLPLINPLQKRASVLQNLMRAYQNCEGDVDADLLEQGISLIEQLRSEESAYRQAAPAFGDSSPRGGNSVADQLEMAIAAELAVQNFDGALRYVRLMPDGFRLRALLRIVQSLIQSY